MASPKPYLFPFLNGDVRKGIHACSWAWPEGFLSLLHQSKSSVQRPTTFSSLAFLLKTKELVLLGWDMCLVNLSTTIFGWHLITTRTASHDNTLSCKDSLWWSYGSQTICCNDTLGHEWFKRGCEQCARHFNQVQRILSYNASLFIVKSLILISLSDDWHFFCASHSEHNHDLH